MHEPLRETRTVCSYCGVGCGVVVQTRGARVVGVRGDETHPTNRGQLCSKGRELHETVHLPDRLLRPLARSGKGGSLRPVPFGDAIDHIARQIVRALARRGPDALGFHLSGQLLTEDYYVFHKLARGFLGTNQIDSNSRLCMSTAVAGYQRAFNADGPPCSYEDLEHADLVLVVGANPAWCHPILWRRFEQAREREGAARPKLVVLDPRRTATASDADLHVPLRPGSDGVFLMALLAELARRGRLDRDFIARATENFEAVELALEAFPLARVERDCGVPAALVRELADHVGAARALLSLWTMGVNQSAHGTDTVSALIDLHLATGQLGRPGAGPFSLTGQPNAMGGREVGAMATLFSAHRALANEAHRREIEAIWGCPPISPEPGRTAVELFAHAAEGGLDVLWIAGTNPAVSMPEQAMVREALRRTPLVIVQDVSLSSETAAYADLLLPAAGFAEKSGTMTNSERGVARVRRAVPPPGECKPDWEIVALVARRLGYGDAFAFRDDAEVWAEHLRTTRGRDCDQSGMTRERLEGRPLQWPCRDASDPGTPRLYTDLRFPTPSGRARFVVPTRFAPVEAVAPGELALTTGRARDQWHTMTKTGAVPELRQHAPEPRLELAPSDASSLGVVDGDPVRVSSPRGAFAARVTTSDAIRPGVAFVPMHFGEARAAGGAVNLVTHGALDPASKQPELKHAAVRVLRPVRGSGRVVVVGAGHAGLALVEALRARDAGREIVLVSAEPYAPYDRIRLPEVLAGEAAAEAITLVTPAWAEARRVELRTSARVVAIDAARRRVRLADGASLPYDQLVLAHGARAVRPALPGIGLPGVRTLRGLADVLGLRIGALAGRRVVVWGTGLLGVEAADALRTAGAEVALVGRSPQLLRRELDARAAGLVEAALSARGVALHQGVEVEAFLGDERLRAVRLVGGEEIACDDAVLALGVEGDLALATGAGLRTGRRIAVDARLATNDRAIFALGDAAEVLGYVAGLAAPARAQAEVLAAVLDGDPLARFEPKPPLVQLAIAGLELRACGTLGPLAKPGDAEAQDVVYEDFATGAYRRLALRRGRLAGFVAVGPCANASALAQLVAGGLRLREAPESLLFPGLEPAHRDPALAAEDASPLVCSCHAVRAARIDRVIAAGAASLAAIGKACAAGTGCGSCRPELTERLRAARRGRAAASPDVRDAAPRTRRRP